MDLDMQALLGEPATIREMSGYEPPAFEIGRALEHYRKSKRKPYPNLLNTKFYYEEVETGKTDSEGDGITENRTTVILCDYEGRKLQKYSFVGNRMTVA
jgi:hypothetical protein